MKRYLILFAFVLGAGCALLFRPGGPSGPNIPGVITVYAQTLPITKVFAWDANPASEQVTSYHPAFDGASLGQVLPTAPLQVPFTITSLGPHTLTIHARNFWGDGPVATININVQTPRAPGGGRVQ